MSLGETRFKVRKKKLGTYPYISVILSITLALFVIGVFGALVIYSKELERIVRENVKIQVYLNTQISDTQRNQIEKGLASKPYLGDGKDAITFVSKDQAAKQFIEETGEDFKNFLGENPLRDAYLVRIKEGFHDSENLKKIKTEIEQIGGVFQVHYIENVIDSINQNLTKIGLVLVGLVVLLLLVVMLLINNTLRLALFSQRFLIRSMQLVGARNWFIQKPFLYRASLHGFVAGILASTLLIALISFATQRVADLALIQNNNRLLLLLAFLIALGMLVAFLSTYRAVSKYLKLSLDELY
ncbi:MAG TPA: permease-like cell division protein FtsX [Cyclobacteriaceae bacterium]|nr:ABC transporter permease [Cytophagales bacterium]HNT49874.1 permease-like cell division protein FtsX [Cyclobacteriaceae bacterium]HRF34203.1 permease-like cell division protein FtsX [Cyclobacteriaceae bacterium]